MTDAATITFPDSRVNFKNTPLEIPPMRKLSPLAKALGLTTNGFRRMCKRGEGPAYTLIAGRMQFTDAAISEWLAKNSRA